MKRSLIVFVVLTAMLSGAFLWQQKVEAQNTPPMTEAHIARIRSNCVEAQSTLNQLHTSDALLRVNQGQLYELISTKLMAPFNARVALNKMDASKLLVVSNDYDRELAVFRTNYKLYEEAMSRTLKINCLNQPVAFYDSVTETRAKRKAVHANIVNLKADIQSYKAEFDTLRANTFKELAQ
jgi:hypothetical protein